MTAAPDLTRLRELMGLGVADAVPADQPRLFEPGVWVMCLGGALPDFNMSLVHDDDPALLRRALDTLGDRAALLALSGPAADHLDRPGAGWQHVGAMPIMTLDLGGFAGVTDPRVRRARTADDAEAICQLASEGFELPRDEMARMVDPTVDGDIALRSWLLEDDGRAVSCVFSALIDGVVSIWTMSTPERFRRQGYARALLETVLAEAVAEGAHTGVLGATPAGFPLYDATGWKTVDEWQLFLRAS